MNANHPGHDAPDCPLRTVVTSRRTDGARGGYGCSWTSGHCLPGASCSSWRLAAENEEVLTVDARDD
jgi:hypothetical protein